MRAILGLIAAVFFVVGCATNEEQEFPEPEVKLATVAGVDPGQAREGYWVYQRKCLECHEARIPEEPLTPGWHATVSGMSWNAGLSDDEQNAVLAYLQTAKE